jgi:hypothetical protein
VKRTGTGQAAAAAGTTTLPDAGAVRKEIADQRKLAAVGV